VVAVDHTRGNAVALRWLLYDGHGNLVRRMAPDYTLSAFQWRGVWGEVQGSLGTGRGYCANLGHPEDETGLVYMRARYYEPATGRFISEDPARHRRNWFAYAQNNPTNRIDDSGLADTLLEETIAEGERASLEAAGSTMIALGIKGRALDLALTIMARYSALKALIDAGFTRGGVFAWRFIDALGNIHRFRFDLASGLLKHDSSSPNAGIPHHIPLQEIIRELIEIFGE
jgi:RHS repeat-associated protein